MKNFTKIILCLLCLFASACEKFVDIPPAAQILQTDQVFTTEQGVTAAVNGVYANIRAGSPSFLNGALSVYAGLSMGEIYNTTTSTTYDPFAKNLIANNNATVNNLFWTGPYHTIYRCNLIMEGIEKSTALSQNFKNRINGEMLVVRSLVYFYLINLYGDVPLVLTTNYNINAVMGRNSTESIYLQLINDLKRAVQLLTPTYPSVGKTRPNLYTAQALLARTMLFHKDYQGSLETADLLLKANVYTLTPDLAKTFLINSTETIWEIAPPAESRNTAEAGLFIPTSATAKPTFAIPDIYVNAFDNSDKRKTTWIGKNVNVGVTYYYPAKFKNRLTTTITEYEIIFRLSEIYLIKAECAAQLNDVSLAVTTLNKVRTRAGLLELPLNISQASALDAILKERQREFIGEWGHRWFDLKRLNQLEQVMAIEKPAFSAFAKWYPIPQTQIVYNQNLTQNDGY